jgi:Thioredoxin domain-containing protein
MRSRKYLLLLSSFILTILVTLIQISNGEIVSLNDATFEHQTQASTGMTTGSWLLFFKATKCPHCQKLEPEYERLSLDEELMEQGVVLGTVNIMESPKTANRFMIRGFPTLIYLHKKKMYRYSGKRDFESIKEFITAVGMKEQRGQGEVVIGEDIPPPPSQWQSWVKMAKAVGLELYDAALGKSGIAGYAILAMVGMLMAILIGIFAICFMPAKKVKSL